MFKLILIYNTTVEIPICAISLLLFHIFIVLSSLNRIYKYSTLHEK